MSITEPVPGLHRIPLMGGFVAAYLLAHDGELTLVDTGPPGSLPEIEDAAREVGLDVGDVTRIVVTHAHADHSGSAAAVRERTGAPILMSAADARLIASGWSSRGLSILPGQEDTLPLPPGVTAEVLAQPAPAEPFDVDTELAEGAVPGVATSRRSRRPGTARARCPCSGAVRAACCSVATRPATSTRSPSRPWARTSTCRGTLRGASPPATSRSRCSVTASR